VPARKRRLEVVRTGRKPATTPEARENQMVSAATDLAEEQILNGTASSQVITHFLKLGSTRERLEQQRLEHENELTRVKIEALESQKRVEELYLEALQAMRSYAGDLPPPDLDEEQ
jgi:DNA-binding IclR family transcriptional regulator